MPNVKKAVRKTTKKKPAKKHGTSGVLSRIKRVERSEFVRMIVFGRSGTGKTTFWSTFPKPILAMTVSGAKETSGDELDSLSDEAIDEGIEHVAIHSTSEIKEVIDYVNREGTFKTVVEDHLTGLQDLILKEVLGVDELPEQKGWGTASQQQWGTVAFQMKEYLRAILSCKSNVVMTAHERKFEPSDEEKMLMGEHEDLAIPKIGSAVSPSVAAWINGACSYVGQTFVRPRYTIEETTIGSETITMKERVPDEEDFCMRIGVDPVVMSRFRMPKNKSIKTGKVVVDPTYDKIKVILQG